jgi:predicted transposase YdaD
MEADMHDKLRSPYDTIVWREGLERGLERGLEQGREEGRQEGRQEGREAGRFSAARDFLEELVEERFGRCDDRLKRLIASVPAESDLKRLARIAARASDIREFERELRTV